MQVDVRLLEDTDATVTPVRYPTVIPAINLFTVAQLREAIQVINDNVETAADRARELAGPDGRRPLEIETLHVAGPSGARFTG